jgi:antitoxin (DNA-binding transcriptional repressor) of toxin-antitoxin stability system
MEFIAKKLETPPIKVLSAASTESYAQSMAKKVDISEAVSSLATLVSDALSGQDVILSRDGEALVKLVPLSSESLSTSEQYQGEQELGFAAKYLIDFDWDDWEASHEEFRRLFKDYEDFK